MARGGGRHGTSLWALRNSAAPGSSDQPVEIYQSPLSGFGPVASPDGRRVFLTQKQQRYERGNSGEMRRETASAGVVFPEFVALLLLRQEHPAAVRAGYGTEP